MDETSSQGCFLSRPLVVRLSVFITSSHVFATPLLSPYSRPACALAYYVVVTLMTVVEQPSNSRRVVDVTTL